MSQSGFPCNGPIIQNANTFANSLAAANQSERTHSAVQTYTTGADATVLFDTNTQSQGNINSILSYNSTTGVFTNISGRLYLAIISYQIAWSNVQTTGFRIAYIARNNANNRFGQSNIVASGDYTTNNGTAMFPVANGETFWIACYSNVNTSHNFLATKAENRIQITLL